MKDHILQELLDAASSSRRHFSKLRKSRHAGAFDLEAPSKEPMVAGKHGRQGLKWNLLVRFWRSRVGQPWDAIWSEVVAAFSSYPDILDQVKRNIGNSSKWQPAGRHESPPLCWIYGGRRGRTFGKYERDIVFYVCPKSARLMVLPRVTFHQKFGTAGGKIPLSPN